MIKNRKDSNLYPFLGIILGGLLMTAHFGLYGIPNNDDSLLHFTFANSVYESIAQGNWFLRIEPDINNGYGGYALRFYPLVTPYFLAVVYAVTKSWHLTGFLFFWFWMSLGGLGVFYLAKEWLDKKNAFIAALLYIFEPYRNAQINLIFANAEFVAGCLLIFCLLFMTRLLKDGKPINLFLLAITYNLLVVSHIPLALIGSLGLGIYGLCHLFYSNRRKTDLGKLLAAFLLGILGASFYLVRFFYELSWINHSNPKFIKVAGQSYDYFFVDVRGYFFSGDLVLYHFLILIFPAGLLILLKADHELRKKTIPLLILTFISIFMSTSFSLPIWKVFGILQNVQFPWRWFVISSIGFGIIIALSVLTLEQSLKAKKLVVTIWTLAFVCSATYFSFVSVIIPNLSNADDFFLKEDDLAQKIDAKSKALTFESMQTVWTKESAFSIKEKALANQRNVEIIKWEPYHKEIRVLEGEPMDVRLAVSYYPYWKSTVNGQKVEVTRTDDGVVSVPVTQENSEIKLFFKEPVANTSAIFFSIFVWFILIGSALFLSIQNLSFSRTAAGKLNQD